ncbi:MAG: LacI family DNA-binding transcriptional regulator [Phycisphaerales bacterium]
MTLTRGTLQKGLGAASLELRDAHESAGAGTTVSIRDIARISGVSVATVSNVISGRRQVRTETADRVRQVMDHADYQPQTKAVDTNRALLLIPDYAGALFSEHVGSLYCSVAQAALDAGLCLSIRKCPQDVDSARDLRHLLRRDGSRGILLLALRDGYALADKLGLERLPHVVVGISRHDHQVNQVVFDDTASARQATQYLIGLGHRRIAIVTFNRTDAGHAQRYDGYRQAIAEAGLETEIGPRLLEGFQSHDLTNGGVKAMQWLAAMNPRPTAVVVTNADLTLQLLRRAQDMGLAIPRDLSIVGYDSRGQLASARPAVTVMRTPIAEMGLEAVSLLKKQLDQGAELPHACRTTICVNHRFEVYQTTASPATESAR